MPPSGHRTSGVGGGGPMPKCCGAGIHLASRAPGIVDEGFALCQAQVWEAPVIPRRTKPGLKIAALLLPALFLMASACRSIQDSVYPAPTAEASEPASPPAPGHGYTRTIKWSTASELDNFGYLVYRAESEDGPFERLNEKPIKGAGTSDEIQRYQFVDSTFDPCQVYYYYVESISIYSVREQFTPINRAGPKAAAVAAGLCGQPNGQ